MEAKTLKQQQVGDIPVSPKYETKDFLETTFWRLRGKLDVPKERFITYPHCNRDADRTPVIGWAGWDHLQQAQAVAGYYERMRTNEGWTDDRLLPLLAGVLELLPWLLQWHNGLDPQYGMAPRTSPFSVIFGPFCGQAIASGCRPGAFTRLTTL